MTPFPKVTQYISGSCNISGKYRRNILRFKEKNKKQKNNTLLYIVERQNGSQSVGLFKLIFTAQEVWKSISSGCPSYHQLSGVFLSFNHAAAFFFFFFPEYHSLFFIYLFFHTKFAGSHSTHKLNYLKDAVVFLHWSLLWTVQLSTVHSFPSLP